MANQTFFQEIQGAAVLKHGILGRYLVGWASKVGSRSKDNLLYYLDGYAGLGTYTDGAPGSPALAVVDRFENGPCLEETMAGLGVSDDSNSSIWHRNYEAEYIYADYCWQINIYALIDGIRRSGGLSVDAPASPHSACRR